MPSCVLVSIAAIKLADLCTDNMPKSIAWAFALAWQPYCAFRPCVASACSCYKCHLLSAWTAVRDKKFILVSSYLSCDIFITIPFALAGSVTCFSAYFYFWALWDDSALTLGNLLSCLCLTAKFPLRSWDYLSNKFSDLPIFNLLIWGEPLFPEFQRCFSSLYLQFIWKRKDKTAFRYGCALIKSEVNNCETVQGIALWGQCFNVYIEVCIFSSSIFQKTYFETVWTTKRRSNCFIAWLVDW